MAQSFRAFIQQQGRSLQIARRRQPDEAVADVFLVKQDEDDEDEDDSRFCQGQDERRGEHDEEIQRRRLWLPDLHRNRFGTLALG